MPTWPRTLKGASWTHAVRRSFRFSDVHGTQLAERVISAIDVMEAGDDAPEISFGSTAPVAIPLENPFFRLAVALDVINSRRSLYTDGEPDASSGNPFPDPFDKWDDSCLLADDEDSCPIQPIDCNTVFENNVGQGVDPRVSEPLLDLIDALH